METKCQSCDKAFDKQDIIVTIDGLFCSQCLPEDVSKRFFTIHLSWQGLMALIAHIEGNPSVDQLFIVDKIKEKLDRHLMEVIRGTLEISKSDPGPMGEGDGEY